MEFRYRFGLLLVVAAEVRWGVLRQLVLFGPATDGFEVVTSMLSVEVNIGLRPLWGKSRFSPPNTPLSTVRMSFGEEDRGNVLLWDQ